METQTPAALKKAALALHALSPADQAWMLARLGLTEQAQLNALLEELQTLGIPQEPAVIEAALQGNKPAQSSSVSPAQDWQGVPVAALAQALADEPAQVMSACLLLLPSELAVSLRPLLPSALQPHTERLPAGVVLTPALREALTQAWLQAARGARMMEPQA